MKYLVRHQKHDFYEVIDGDTFDESRYTVKAVINYESFTVCTQLADSLNGKQTAVGEAESAGAE